MLRILVTLFATVVAFAAAQAALADDDNVITTPDARVGIGRGVSLALDAAGNPVIGYRFDERLQIMHCDDPDCAGEEHFTKPDPLHAGGGDIALVLDSDGNPVVSHSSYRRHGGLTILHCDDPACDGTGESITYPDSDESPQFIGSSSSLELDAIGNPVVVYQAGFPSYDLRVLHCGDPNCTAENSITSPDTDGDVGSYASLKLDDDGNPVVSYYDRTNRQLKVMHCNDPDCSGNDESITTPDLESFTGRFSALDLDAMGNPVVSYYAEEQRRIRLLHCDDPNCDGTNDSITAPEDWHLSGFEISALLLDSVGHPVIVYRGGDDMKVVRCDDPKCSGGGETIRIPARFGRYLSLALDPFDNPVVAYKGGNGSLMVLHCGSSTCAGKGPGDVDCDGTVDSSDATFVLKYVVGFFWYRDFACPFLDLNGDRVIDSFDALFILQIEAGLIPRPNPD